MARSKRNTEAFFLLIILIIGAAFRFYNYYSWSLSNDELSALTRLNFSSFSEMIEKGAAIDGHPVGVQSFLYYWVKLFGESEVSVRLPFIIAGILSILFAYLIAERWFNRTTGLFVAISLACLQFPILYSQLARPYSPGLLFSLSMVYFWTLILFPSKQNRSKSYTDSKTNIAGFVISTSACMYTHYFAFMFAGIVCLTGLLFIDRNNSKAYIISGILIILLYIPHFNIFRQQLSYGGVGEWLGKPTKDFLRTFIEYGFNGSDIVFYMMWGICIFSFIIFRQTLELSKFHIITLLWFLLPYLIGYYYSVHINPVLQYSTLLFSFPFLLIFIFSFIPDVLDDIKTIVILFIVGAVISVSTVFGNNFYSTQHFAVFKELAQDVIKWDDQYGEQNITRTINVFHPNYIQYYMRKYDKKTSFAIYETNSPQLIAKLKTIVDTATTQYFIYGWSNIYSDPVINEIIKSKYPNIVEEDTFFHSAITLYSKKSNAEPQPKVIYEKSFDFEEIKPVGKDSQLVSEDFAHSGTHSIKLDNNTEYSPGITESLSTINTIEGIVDASVWVYLPDTSSETSLVITFESNGKVSDWYSVSLKDYAHQPNKWTQVIGSRKIPNAASSADIMKVYIWNKDKNTLYFDDLDVKIYKQ
jgi:uncharacterized membrane protein